MALAVGDNVFVSQHIGDLETHQSLEAFRAVERDLQALYDHQPVVVVCDMHPDYFSSKEAKRRGGEVVEIQHHFAHVLSCMAENELSGEVLGVSWDGTGYGPDGTVWGGEFLVSDGSEFGRVACLKPFRLPGAERAVKEPRRSAAGLLFEIFGDEAFRNREQRPFSEFTIAELSVLHQMLRRGVNAPRTSSVGRLFDAVASLVGLRQQNNFEGQAAMELEFALAGETSEQSYRCDVRQFDDKTEDDIVSPQGASYRPRYVVDWSAMIEGIITDVRRCVPVSLLSKKFHNALVGAIVEVAEKVGIPRVVLTGGCFQNQFLTERCVKRLQAAGFQAYWHQRVPPNDGGISLGQAYAALLMGRRLNLSERQSQGEVGK